MRQHADQRYVQRTFDCPVGRDGTVKCLVIVLRHKTVDVQRYIRYEGGREYLSVVQHAGIKERFQDAPRATGGSDDIDLVSPFFVGLEGGISSIGQDFSGFHVGDKGSQVMDMVGTAVFRA